MVAGRTGQTLGVGVVERQRVDREVVGLEPQRRVERRAPVLDRLARDVGEQVEPDRSDAGRPRTEDRIGHIRHPVTPAEPAQQPLIEALRPDREARHTRGPEAGQVAAVVRPRVDLERDLGIVPDAEPAIDALKETGDRLGREE